MYIHILALKTHSPSPLTAIVGTTLQMNVMCRVNDNQS